MSEKAVGIEQTTLKPQERSDENGSSKKDLEKKEVTDGLLVPRISNFPEKVQPIIKDAFLKAHSSGEALGALVGNVTRVVTKRQEKRVDQQEVLDLVEGKKGIKVEDKEKEAKYLETVIKEILLLQKAYGKVSQGKDVPELRNSPSPFAAIPEAVRVEFTEDEIRRYGKPKNIKDRARKLFALVKPGSSEGSQEFKQKMAILYKNRVQTIIFNGIASPGIQPAFDDQGLGVFRTALEAPLGERADKLVEAYDQYFNTARQVAADTVRFNSYTARLEEWVKQQAHILNKVDLYGDKYKSLDNLGEAILSKIDHARMTVNYKKTHFVQNVSGISEGVIYNYTKNMGDYVFQIANDLLLMASPMGYEGGILTDSSLSSEYLTEGYKTQAQLQTLKEYMEVTGTGASLAHSLGMAIERLEGLKQRGELRSKANKELVSSEDLLFHAAPWDIFKSILEKGVLASKQYQLDHYGESSFHSGGIKVGKDHVEVTDGYGYKRQISKQEYESKPKDSLAKTPDQEAHQICFSENGPYMYYSGVALVFSKRNLFSKGQFMDQDGWHVFDKGFVQEDKDTPGFAADLTKEPVLLVVDEKLKPQMEDFVKSDLFQNSRWGVEDANKWIEEKVIFVPSASFSEFQRGTVDEIRTKFFQKNQVDAKLGWVVATGEKGETAVRSLAPLYTYKQAA